ncbi:hypothetical protein BGZ57DRAFT_859424 [Hyaloscypha finlandica]|nr:hypothetical protein BGZ57DRAFT_859424 [Hyaloscypha finlandica]
MLGQAGVTSRSKVDFKNRNLYLGKGLALFKEQVVYVEMRDYRGPPLELTPEQKQQMKRRRNRARHYSKADMGQTYEYSSSDEAEEDVKPIKPVRLADPKFRALIRNFFNTF